MDNIKKIIKGPMPGLFSQRLVYQSKHCTARVRQLEGESFYDINIRHDKETLAPSFIIGRDEDNCAQYYALWSKDNPMYLNEKQGFDNCFKEMVELLQFIAKDLNITIANC